MSLYASFVREKMQNDVREGLIAMGIAPDKFSVHVNITPISTTDPEVIYVDYQSVLPNSEYIAHTVKVEVSGRSISETAYMLGFDYPHHLTRMFKNKTGITSGEYMRGHAS